VDGDPSIKKGGLGSH